MPALCVWDASFVDDAMVVVGFAVGGSFGHFVEDSRRKILRIRWN